MCGCVPFDGACKLFARARTKEAGNVICKSCAVHRVCPKRCKHAHVSRDEMPCLAVVGWRLWRAYPDQRVCQSTLPIQSGSRRGRRRFDPSLTCMLDNIESVLVPDSVDAFTYATLQTSSELHTGLALVEFTTKPCYTTKNSYRKYISVVAEQVHGPLRPRDLDRADRCSSRGPAMTCSKEQGAASHR